MCVVSSSSYFLFAAGTSSSSSNTVEYMATTTTYNGRKRRGGGGGRALYNTQQSKAYVKPVSQDHARALSPPVANSFSYSFLNRKKTKTKKGFSSSTSSIAAAAAADATKKRGMERERLVNLDRRPSVTRNAQYITKQASRREKSLRDDCFLLSSLLSVHRSFA